jgi:mannose-6-phosphate isomerase-like protein (cupin superfamily)
LSPEIGRRLGRLAALAGAFVAGALVMRLGGVAHADSPPLTTQVVDVAAMTVADLPAPRPGENPNLRTKAYVDEPGAVIRVQVGTVPKHYHVDANEVQYIVDGTGTEWLGDKQITIKPGIMLIIPKGVTHGGLVEKQGHLKIIAFKTPPQTPTDNHPIP